MFVVMVLNTYAGDGCEQGSGYSVSQVVGPFSSDSIAQAWVDKQEKTYSVDYEVSEVEQAA